MISAQPVSTDENWQPTIKFIETEHNFGEIPEGPKAMYDFTFTNSGKEPIAVERAQASCGCTEPEVTKESIAPGKTGTIKVGYNSDGRPGNFDKTITVFVKGGVNGEKKGTLLLKIKGNVLPKKVEDKKPEEAGHEDHDHQGHHHDHGNDSLMTPSKPLETIPVKK